MWILLALLSVLRLRHACEDSQGRKTMSKGVRGDQAQWRNAWGRGMDLPPCPARWGCEDGTCQRLCQVRRKTGPQGLREVRGAQTCSHTGSTRGYHMCSGWGGASGGGTSSGQRGPDPETPTLTRMSPSKFLALRPLVSSVEQTSECTVLTLF